MDLDFTPRNVAKYVVKAAVQMKVTQLTRDAMVDHTRFENDDMIVKIGAGVVGWGVSDKLKPYTDKAVDHVADFIVAKREARENNKKDNTDENEK